MKSSYKIIFIICCLCLVALQPVLYHSAKLDPDEGYFMFMGKSVLNGSIPYIDYTDNKPPGIWYLMAFTFLVFGKSIYAAKGILYAVNALSALILYLIGKELRYKKIGIISSLFFLVGMLIPAFEGFRVYTEPFLSFFSLLGLLFFIKGREQKSYLIACGAAVGMATLFKQTGILLLVAIFVFYLVNFWIPVNRSNKYLVSSAGRALLLLCGFLAVILPVVAYFWSVGALTQLAHYTIWGLKGYGSSFEGIRVLGYQFASFCIVWVLSGASLLTIGYKFIKKSSDWETLVSIWLLLTLCPLFFRQWGHYYIQILPPACLLASLFLVNIQPKLLQIKKVLKQHDIKYIFALAGVIVLVVASVGISSRQYILDRSEYNGVSLQYQEQTADYIRSHTTGSDTILVYPYQPSIYFLSDRNPCVKILILERPVIDENTELELLQQIMLGNPKYVVVQMKGNETVWGLPHIYEYIVSHFEKEESIGSYEIYKKS
jgi:4-amino-4-deoxy-L-arabinose transferase-like glycosyltransferase